jgi:hypothetical protein
LFQWFLAGKSEYYVAKRASARSTGSELGTGVTDWLLGPLPQSLYATDLPGGSGQRAKYFDMEGKSVLIDFKNRARSDTRILLIHPENVS